MRSGSGSICKETGGLDDDVYAVVFPRDFRGVFLGQYFNLFPVDENTVFDSFYGAFILAEGAVPF